MEPYLGQIQPFGFNFAPRGWASCEGQLLPIAQYSALFSLLGTTFGGDGRTTFGLPDLRGRQITGQGNGPGLDNVTWGEKGGAERQTLTAAQIPQHTHNVKGSTAEGDNTVPTGGFVGLAATDFYAEESNTTAGPTDGGTGGGQSFPILDPYLGIWVCIATQGVYPSRN